MKAERRRHIRVPGPFKAAQLDRHETPVRLVNLSEGGCFIEFPGDDLPADPVTLKIWFPGGKSLVVRGETLYRRPGIGYALLFSDLADTTYRNLERAIARIRGETS